MNLRTLLLVLFCLLFSVQVAFSEATYFVTDKQLSELTKQINSLTSSNESMKSLLALQTKEYETLEQQYLDKYLAIKKQQTNYQNLLDRYESRNSIYKYSIGVAFVVGLVLGFVIAK